MVHIFFFDQRRAGFQHTFSHKSLSVRAPSCIVVMAIMFLDACDRLTNHLEIEIIKQTLRAPDAGKNKFTLLTLLGESNSNDGYDCPRHSYVALPLSVLDMMQMCY